jgi:nicotinamidase-related amidase
MSQLAESNEIPTEKQKTMPLTMLDPKPALIVIDVQRGIVDAPTIQPVAEIVERSARLADAFRYQALPVVLVNVTAGPPGRTDRTRSPGIANSPDWADLVDELGAHPDDHLVTKQARSAFHDTGLDEYLRGVGVTQVVLTGISTTSGVESTARSAYDHGYHVVLTTDAMTDTDPDAHANSLERIFPKLGETATTTEILDALEDRQ